jgi:hypothetical protein
VFYETQLISKESKSEPKLVLILSKRKRLVSVVSQNSKRASFMVSLKPKLTTLDAKQSKTPTHPHAAGCPTKLGSYQKNRN